MRLLTQPSWPFNIALHFLVWMSHIRRVWSNEPLTSVRSSWERTQQFTCSFLVQMLRMNTQSECPWNTWMDFLVLRSHKIKVESFDPVTRIESSREMTQQWTFEIRKWNSNLTYIIFVSFQHISTFTRLYIPDSDCFVRWSSEYCSTITGKYTTFDLQLVNGEFNPDFTLHSCPFNSAITWCAFVSQILTVLSSPPLASSELSLDRAQQRTFTTLVNFMLVAYASFVRLQRLDWL